MGCYDPIPAKQLPWGGISLWKKDQDGLSLRLPCGSCIGCRTSQAKAWALRCQLELQSHESAAFTTLTYDDEHVPVTLSPRHLQLFIKRARKALGSARPIRFFASGEYGETTQRPHYHAILYGAAESDRDLLHRMWGAGHIRVDPITPQRIAYCAGYTSKKIGYRLEADPERIDYITGEIYRWQPPFIQMSRRPGIGGEARRFINSWRLYAVNNGSPMPVPRYLHNAWKAQATDSDLEELSYQKHLLSLKRDSSEPRLKAAQLIAISKQNLDGAKRTL